MYAVVEIAGQQFKVQNGQEIFVHRLEGEEGASIAFNKVLLVENEGNVSIGLPVIDGAATLIEKFNALRTLRADVTKRLEEVRAAGGIGSSLQAEVELKVTASKYALLNSLGDDLKFILITSAATVTEVASAAEETILVTPSSQQKCERCWHYRADVGSHAEHVGLCGRCVSNLFGSGEDRHFA